MTTNITAGTVLAAAEALRERRGGTWTDREVAVLLRLAYEAGRSDAYREDLAELRIQWEDNRLPRLTYEECVARRREEIRSSRREDLRPDHPGGPVDWETGYPLRHLYLVKESA